MFRIQKKKTQPTNKTGGQTLGSRSPHRSLPDTATPAPGAALSPSYGSWGQLSAPWAPFHDNPRPRDAAGQHLHSGGLCRAQPHQVTATGQSPLHQSPALTLPAKTALAGRKLDAPLPHAPNPQSPHPSSSIYEPPSASPTKLPHGRARRACPWGCPLLAGSEENQNPGDHRRGGTHRGDFSPRAPSHGTANEAPALCQEPHAARGCEHRRCPRNPQRGMGGASILHTPGIIWAGDEKATTVHGTRLIRSLVPSTARPKPAGTQRSPST